MPPNSFDITGTMLELKDVYNNFEEWSKPQSVPFSLAFAAMRPRVQRVPKGTVLIIAPFNFPLFLLLGPLVRVALCHDVAAAIDLPDCRAAQIGAIAAGNAAVLKPSEQTPNVAALLTELLPKYLDPDLYQIVNGGVPEATKVRLRRAPHSQLC